MAEIKIREIYINLGFGKSMTVRFDVKVGDKVEHYAIWLFTIGNDVRMSFAKLKDNLPLSAIMTKNWEEISQWGVEISIMEFGNQIYNVCNVILPHVASVSMIPCSEKFFDEILTKIEQVMQSIDI